MKRGVVIAAVLMMGLAGCATSGVQQLENETQQSLGGKLEVGKTTKSEVLVIMGAPTHTTFTDSGLEVISYEFKNSTPRWRNFIPYNVLSQVHDSTRKQLTVLFAEDGTVQRYVLNEAETEERWGILE